jgi:hypothetical protein
MEEKSSHPTKVMKVLEASAVKCSVFRQTHLELNSRNFLKIGWDNLQKKRLKKSLSPGVG